VNPAPGHVHHLLAVLPVSLENVGKERQLDLSGSIRPTCGVGRTLAVSGSV
jgi:ABC-type taurine transport system ATPase subunit